MNDQFVPHKPDEYVTVKIKKREAILIEKLRKHAFGKFTVLKSSNTIIRVEIQNSEIIDENAEINL